uniref:Uncharacterized protein n=1 Tax=Chenopodium quinoa TaxID=63459 RepID=A0A803MNU2_CHEQI
MDPEDGHMNEASPAKIAFLARLAEAEEREEETAQELNTVCHASSSADVEPLAAQNDGEKLLRASHWNLYTTAGPVAGRHSSPRKNSPSAVIGQSQKSPPPPPESLLGSITRRRMPETPLFIYGICLPPIPYNIISILARFGIGGSPEEEIGYGSREPEAAG